MTPAVCLHASRFEGEDQTYADPAAGETVDGWCVYLRRDTGTCSEPFQIDVDEDFDTREAAWDFANDLARQYDCPVQVY